MLAQKDCTTRLLTWRATTVLLSPPPQVAHVYLLHFAQKLGSDKAKGSAQHYLGSTAALSHRLALHRAGTSQAAIMECLHERGISFELVRLWQFPTTEEARLFERYLKKRGHNPRECAICNPRRGVDPLVYLRQGHQQLERPQAPRRPMSATRAVFVHR